MTDKAKPKGPSEQQPNITPADTGDRELSDADLDKVSGGAQSTEPPPPRRTPPARAM